MQITLAEAVELSRDKKITVGEIEAMGFEVIAVGAANVEAKANEPEINEALVAHAAALFEAGTPRGKTKAGRPQRTLGTKTGTYPYNVSVSIDPNYKA